MAVLTERSLNVECICQGELYAAFTEEGALAGIDAPCSDTARTLARLGEQPLTECERAKRLMLATVRGERRIERSTTIKRKVRAFIREALDYAAQVTTTRAFVPSLVGLVIREVSVPSSVRRASNNVKRFSLSLVGGETGAPEVPTAGYPAAVELAEVSTTEGYPAWAKGAQQTLNAVRTPSSAIARYHVELAREMASLARRRR